MPKDVDQLARETFAIYRRDLQKFLLISSVPQIPLLFSILTPFWLSVWLSLISITIYILANVAIIHAVVQQCISRNTQIGPCFQRAVGQAPMIFITYVLVLLALSGAGLLIPFIIGIPIFFYLLVSWLFIGQTIVIEHKSSMGAMERSRSLVSGTWWRVFGITTILLFMFLGLDAIILTLSLIVDPTIAIILQIIVNAVVFPLIPIGITMVYFDLRIRKENFSLEKLITEPGATIYGIKRSPSSDK